VEFKETFDPSDAQQSVEILKDIVAIANSGGGALAIGVKNSGVVVGIDVSAVLNHDHAKYCDLIRKYTLQDFCDFEVVPAERDGHPIAVFLIGVPDYPIVFEKPGTYPIGNNKQMTAFAQGTVYFRHGAKSEPGTTEDLRKFMQDRVREMHDQLMKGLRKVEVAQRGAHLEVVPAAVVVADKTTAAIRLTDDPAAPNAIAINRDDICKYRQKEVLAKVRELLPDGPWPTSHDMQAINRIYGILGKKEFAWKPQFSSPQYGESFVEWLVESIRGDGEFLTKTRRKYKDLLTGNLTLPLS